MIPLLFQEFERHAAQRPEATALRYLGESMNYGELNMRSNQIAHALIAHGCRPGSLVLLAMDRSPEAIVALLGILKTGAAYVPLDSFYPEAWRRQIATQCEPTVVVGDDLGLVSESVSRLMPQDAALTTYPGSNPQLPINVDSLMYVMYTSGTTGQPKGVMVSHANVARLFPALQEHLAFSSHDIWTFFHSCAFGFSVWEIWGALAHGGTLVVVPAPIRSRPRQLLELLAGEHVTVLSQTPSAFRSLVRAVCEENLPDFSPLRLVAFSGEPVEQHVLARWFSRLGDSHPRLVNMYAATETSGEVAFKYLRQRDTTTQVGTSIGSALLDTTFHVLDTCLKPVQLGTVGELYVGGPAIALGYWRNETLTNERFIEDPFELGTGRLFRTGDLACKNDDGTFDLVGRADAQVKINGYRIDTHGVAEQMVTFSHIRDAVVLTEQTPGGDFMLTGYYVAMEPGAVSANTFKQQLADCLPRYSVPTKLAEVPDFPLTPNGKLDVDALRMLAVQPHGQVEASMNSDVASVLAEIWKDLLGVKDYPEGEEDLIQQGGDSMTATALADQIGERLGLHVRMGDVFNHSRFRDLVAWLETSRTEISLRTKE